MRAIDADAFKADYGMKDDCADCEKEMRGKTKACEYDRIYSKMDFCGWIDDAPTIEPQRKKGKWIYLDKDKRFFHPHIVKCSVCDNILDMYGVNAGRGDANFCPNCGADMRKDGEADANADT